MRFGQPVESSLAMSDARSLTPLSEIDYDAIAAAVMETARGRWFLTEYARRNRQADTEIVLTAIGRLERLCNPPAMTLEPSHGFPEAARAIAELREDLDRAGVGRDGPSSRLSSRIHESASTVLHAAEAIQEIAWTLREAGAEGDLCDKLDRRATEIYSATAMIEAGADQIEKMADTVAMLDSSLRAVVDGASFTLGEAFAATPAWTPEARAPLPAKPTSDPADIDVIEVGTQERAPLTEAGGAAPAGPGYRRLNSAQGAEEDIVFADIGAPPAPAMTSMPGSSARIEVSYSEADLRAIDSLPAEDRLRFFA